MEFSLKIIDVIDSQLCEQALNNDRDYSYFHASAWGKCHRKIAYEYYEAKGYIKVDTSSYKIDPRVERIFGNGHTMHDRWRQYIEDTGMLRGWWMDAEGNVHGQDNKHGILKPEGNFVYVEVGFRDKDTMWGGHVDAIVDIREHPSVNANGQPLEKCLIIVDFKTMNTFGFKKLTKPTDEHYTQMQLYLYLSGLNQGRFIYEDKNDQKTKEYIVPRDNRFITQKVREAKELKHIVTNTKSNNKHPLPVRGYSSRSNVNCLSCKFRGHCWEK